MSFDSPYGLIGWVARVLAGEPVRGCPVHRCGRGEYDLSHAGAVAALEQAAGGAGVVAVVLERVRDRLRHDGVRGEVHYRLDAVLRQHAIDQRAISGIAHHQRRVQHGAAISGAEIIEHDHALVALGELAHDVAANIAGAPGDEHGLHGARS